MQLSNFLSVESVPYPELIIIFTPFIVKAEPYKSEHLIRVILSEFLGVIKETNSNSN